MAIRRPSVLFLAATVAGLAASPAFVQADPAPTAVGDAQPYVGAVTADDVYVRSGPSEGFYATQKLNKGDRVTIVGIRGAEGEWLKIVPPDGSFCYVAQAYVDRVPGSDTDGRVKKPELNVRAGSLLNGSKKTRLMTLNTGDPVRIVGVQDDYFKIAPPPGAYLYVQRSLVTAVPAAAPVSIPLTAQANEREPIASDPIPTATPPAPVAQAPAAAPSPAPKPVGAVPLVPATPAVAAAASSVAPTTRPADAASLASARMAAPAATSQPTALASATPAQDAPSTRPAEVSPQERFDIAEADFARATRLPLDRQPLEGLRWRYKTLANNAALPPSLRQVALSRMTTLALRIDARRQMVEADRLAADTAARERALTAEQQELAQRVKDEEVTTYAALGTLRISSLQQSGPTLYRLTDPNTGRTLIYLRSNDPKYTGLLNQFIGVHGPITQDDTLSLRYVTPLDAEPVDVTKVNIGITAAVMPPSLLNRSITASVGGS